MEVVGEAVHEPPDCDPREEVPEGLVVHERAERKHLLPLGRLHAARDGEPEPVLVADARLAGLDRLARARARVVVHDLLDVGLVGVAAQEDVGVAHDLPRNREEGLVVEFAHVHVRVRGVFGALSREHVSEREVVLRAHGFVDARRRQVERGRLAGRQDALQVRALLHWDRGPGTRRQERGCGEAKGCREVVKGC